MLLACPEHGAGPATRRRWSYSGIEALDPHDLAWGLFFRVLADEYRVGPAMGFTYRVEHVRVSYVWPGSPPEGSCRLLTWYHLPQVPLAWVVLPEYGPLDMELGLSLSRRLGCPVVVASYPPGRPRRPSSTCPDCLALPADYDGPYLHDGDYWQMGASWVQCPRCLHVGIVLRTLPFVGCRCGNRSRAPADHGPALCRASGAAGDYLWLLEEDEYLRPSWASVVFRHMLAGP